MKTDAMRRALAIGIGVAVVAAVVGAMLIVFQGLTRETELPSPEPISVLVPTSYPIADAASATPTRGAPSASPTPPPTATPRPAPTERPTATPTPRAFKEDFEGSALDTRRWRIAATTGGVRVDNLLRLSGGSAGFAFVDSVVDPFADFDDFTLSARLRFPQPNACGVGLLATSYRMPVGLSQADTESVQRREEQNGLTMGVWADATQGMRVWYRSGSTRQEIKVAEADSAWHVLEISRANNAYRISLDSRFVFQAPATAALPRVLSMGNAAVVPTCAGYWTGLEVDSVSATGAP